jgi:hypothetical protein
MDHATQAFGFAVPGGTDSEVGIAGGCPWAAETAGSWAHWAPPATTSSRRTLVTADGALLTPSATENEDLFWALRGGGGNLSL